MRQDFTAQWQREQEEWLRNAFENLNDGGDHHFISNRCVIPYVGCMREAWKASPGSISKKQIPSKAPKAVGVSNFEQKSEGTATLMIGDGDREPGDGPWTRRVVHMVGSV